MLADLEEGLWSEDPEWCGRFEARWPGVPSMGLAIALGALGALVAVTTFTLSLLLGVTGLAVMAVGLWAGVSAAAFRARGGASPPAVIGGTDDGGRRTQD